MLNAAPLRILTDDEQKILDEIKIVDFTKIADTFGYLAERTGLSREIVKKFFYTVPFRWENDPTKWPGLPGKKSCWPKAQHYQDWLKENSTGAIFIDSKAEQIPTDDEIIQFFLTCEECSLIPQVSRRTVVDFHNGTKALAVLYWDNADVFKILSIPALRNKYKEIQDAEAKLTNQV